MSGTISYSGGVSVGALVPGVFAVYAGMLAQLQAKLRAQIKLLARIQIKPPSLAANLSMALQMVAQLRAGIAIGMPGIDFQIAMAAKVIIEIEAQLAILLGLSVPLATAGVHAYAYDGTADSFGSELSNATSGGLPGGSPGGHVRAVIYATEIDAAWAAMGLVLRTG